VHQLEDSRPDEAARKPDAVRPITQSKARTVEGAAATRARIKLQGRVVAPVAMGKAGMSGVNTTLEVGKHQLETRWVLRDSCGPGGNEPRAIQRFAQRLASGGC